MRAGMRIALAVLALAAVRTPTVAAGVPGACGAGRFLVRSNALAGLTSDPLPVLSIGSDGTIDLSGCGPTLARVRVNRASIRVTARWDQCGAIVRPRLVAVVSTQDCQQVVGRLRGRRTRLDFTAFRSSCGDFLVDPATESCDGTAPNGDAACAGTVCNSVCTCGTSTTTTPTTTCPTFTTTTVPLCGTGSFCAFNAWCPNAKACIGDGMGGCGCSGPDLACGAPGDFSCGGTCPDGMTCDGKQAELFPGCFYPAGCGCMPVIPD